MRPFWIKVVKVLSSWSASVIPLIPALCLLGDRSQTPNISKGEFSVVMVGLITASRIILRHWKTAEPLNLKEWINVIVEAAAWNLRVTDLKEIQKMAPPLWTFF